MCYLINMKIFVAPAKTFANNPTPSSTSPIFIEKSNFLWSKLEVLNKDDLKEGLKLSDALGEEVYTYYQNKRNYYQAITLYQGAFYKGFDYQRVSSTIDLYILDALYGLINAKDGIRPYRLDFSVSIFGNLYKYWDSLIADYINKNWPNELLIDLSSKEFSRLLNGVNNLYRIDFQYSKTKIDNMTKKRIRGRFAAYLLNNEIVNLEQVKKIELDGFVYSKNLSSKNELIFIK